MEDCEVIKRKKAKSAIVKGLLDVTKTAKSMLGDSDSPDDVSGSMEGIGNTLISPHCSSSTLLYNPNWVTLW